MDSTKIPCKVCGKFLKYISSTHLSMHSLTVVQYKEKYGEVVAENWNSARTGKSRIVEGNKECLTCKEIKDVSLFGFRTYKGKEYVISNCIECRLNLWKTKNKKNYYENEEVRNSVKARNKNLIKTRQLLIFFYLSSHPCVDCGENNPCMLEFDHVRGEKLFNISHGVNDGNPLEDILTEIAKCDVRCRNCHMLRTAQSRNYYSYRLRDEYLAVLSEDGGAEKAFQKVLDYIRNPGYTSSREVRIFE